MKQITEPAPIIHEFDRGVPEDLSLAVARCLEKDPENRWGTADALRRALENRSVGTYRPTLKTAAQPRRTGTAGASRTGSARGTSPRPRPASTDASAPAAANAPRRAARRAASPPRPRGHRASGPAGVPAGSGTSAANGCGRANSRSMGVVRDTGEPVIVQKVRAQFARWAAVSLGCFALNLATGIDSPWFLFPAAGMGIGLLTNYAKLWQSGYSWRDVLNRPPAADAILAPGPKGKKALIAPKPEEFGAHYDSVRRVFEDRAAIIALMQRLSPGDRELLPDVMETVGRALREGAGDGAHAPLDGRQPRPRRASSGSRSDWPSCMQEPESDERNRRVTLLEQQRKAYQDLIGRRGTVADRLESSLLAMQNMRFDLLRLRSAGVGAVVNDLTQATQQARALSRDVDHAIAAASEVREALG